MARQNHKRNSVVVWICAVQPTPGILACNAQEVSITCPSSHIILVLCLHAIPSWRRHRVLVPPIRPTALQCPDRLNAEYPELICCCPARRVILLPKSPPFRKKTKRFRFFQRSCSASRSATPVLTLRYLTPSARRAPTTRARCTSAASHSGRTMRAPTAPSRWTTPT